MTRRVGSRHFVTSGAVGGLVGFLLMEVVSVLVGTGVETRSGNLVQNGIYFSGFGLAVGAALGMTEGFVRKNRFRLWYGLVVGLALGAGAGFVGGVVGQAIYGLAPLRYAVQSNFDLVIALDSSGSMRELLFWGSDPWGERKKAAKRLVDRLSHDARVAVVDFDQEATVRLPLTSLKTSDARRRAAQAIDQVGSLGGTSLDAGLTASFRELQGASSGTREQHVIFLTDGVGDYTPERYPPDLVAGVTVHTVGLGGAVDADLLTEIAASSGGTYYPVSDASELIAVFENIFTEQVSMTDAASGEGPGELLTPGWLLVFLRVLSWGVIGAAIGASQGVTYNTREDLRACATGGLAGGLVGGMLFDWVAVWSGLGSGLPAARLLADVVVGATIGGSLKLAQGYLVEQPATQTTTLLAMLPDKNIGLETETQSGDEGRAALPTVVEDCAAKELRGTEV